MLGKLIDVFRNLTRSRSSAASGLWTPLEGSKTRAPRCWTVLSPAGPLGSTNASFGSCSPKTITF